jgi:hypothetical protein
MVFQIRVYMERKRMAAEEQSWTFLTVIGTYCVEIIEEEKWND